MAVPRFPQMVANSREVTWSPPAGTGRLQASGQLKDAALAPAVLQVLEARGCDDAAAVRRLSAETLEQMGVPPRYRDALAAALAAPAKWGDDDSDDAPPAASRRRARVDDEAPAEAPKISIGERARLRREQATAAAPPVAAPPPAPVPQEWATATSGNRASRRAASAAAPKAPTRAATSPGFVFLCNRLSRGEVRNRKLFGLGKGQLRDMEKHITANTPLFLYDFDAKTLTGPCTPDGAPSLDIDRAAWKRRFPAQLRFKEQLDSVPTLRNTKYKSGPLPLADTRPLLARLASA